MVPDCSGWFNVMQGSAHQAHPVQSKPHFRNKSIGAFQVVFARMGVSSSYSPQRFLRVRWPSS